MKDIVFDIDGTLANCEHRQHFLRSKPKNWRAFEKGIHLDSPHDDIIWLLKTLHAAGNTIILASARNENEREATETWLREVAGIGGLYTKLYLREAGDYRDDGIVKSEILDQMYADGFDPTMVFDDRNRVVNMWRERGIRCLQVAPGDF